MLRPIREMAGLLEEGFEMNIFIVMNNNLIFHSYLFEYSSTCKLTSPTLWIINNLLFSLLHQQECINQFPDIISSLRCFSIIV